MDTVIRWCEDGQFIQGLISINKDNVKIINSI